MPRQCAPCADLQEGPTVRVHAFRQHVPVEESGSKATGKQTNYDIDALPLQQLFPDSQVDGFNGSQDVGKDAKLVRVFRFASYRESRIIEVKKKDNTWYIFVDNVLFRTGSHRTPKEEAADWAKNVQETPGESRVREGVLTIDFRFPEFSAETKVAKRLGDTLAAKAYMRWCGPERRWSYAMRVEGVALPTMYADCGNAQFSSYIPDVVQFKKQASEDDVAEGEDRRSKTLYTLDEINKGNKDYQSMFDDKEEVSTTVRIWRFYLDDELRGIEVSHRDSLFKVFVDGIKVGECSQAHDREMDRSMICLLNGWAVGCSFPVRVCTATGSTTSIDDNYMVGRMRIHWSRLSGSWDYELIIGSQYILPCVFKGDPCAPSDFFSTIVPRITRDQVFKLDQVESIMNEKSDLDWKKQDWSIIESRKKEVSPFLSYTVRLYYFTIRFKLCTIAIAHAAGKWSFHVDGVCVADKTHGSWSASSARQEETCSFKIPGESLEATCTMTWSGAKSTWSYNMIIRSDTAGASINDTNDKEVEILPMYAAEYGPEGSGRILELVKTREVGLEANRYRFLFDQLAQATHVTGSALLVQDAFREGTQVVVEKEWIGDFNKDACLRIEGLNASDPQEFRTVIGTANTGVIQLDAPLESDHAKGALVKQIAKKEDHTEKPKSEAICQAELDHILKIKLKNKDDSYGIRFFPGEARMGFESELAVTIDIAQLLIKFPSFHVKIVGYSAAKSPDDMYKTDDDVKYLALMRCEVVRQMLERKDVTNLIGIESRGYDPLFSSSCLIEMSEESEIAKCNDVAKKFLMDRAQSKEMRFAVKTRVDVEENYLAIMDSDTKDANVISFERGEVKANEIDTKTHVSNSLSRAHAMLRNTNGNDDNQQHNTRGALSLVARDGTQASVKQRMDIIQSYMPHEEVEYFSRTNKKWLSAYVTKVTFDDNSDHARGLYDLIFLRNRSIRCMAEMQSLRKPLGQDNVRTLVEVFSKRGHGSWLPGYIEGYQSSAAALGYTVMLKMEDGRKEVSLENVPAERIRRRFTSNMPVQFYVSGKFGWKDAVVANVVADGWKDGCLGHNTGAIQEMQWLKTDFHESQHLRTIQDTTKYADLMEKELIEAMRTPREPTAEREEREAEEEEERKAEAKDDKEKVENSNDGTEPWTMVPILVDARVAEGIGIDETVAKEIVVDGHKKWEYKVELWRLRQPVETAAEKPVILGLEDVDIIERGGTRRQLVSL